MRAKHFASGFAVVLIAVAAVVAQTPKPATVTSPTNRSTAPATTSSSVQQTLQDILEEPTGADTYRYDPQGRRDPFQSLIGPTPRAQSSQRPPGVPGFLIDEVKLSGIVKTGQGLVGMVNGPDNKGYLLRVGDKLFDGEVIRVTPTSVVFRQEVNDPTRIERYREVVKDLAPEASRK